jgi:DNA polymerase
MLGWAFDDDPVELWVPDGPWDYGSLPREVRRAMLRGHDLCAHNVEFEQNVFWHVLGLGTPWRQWMDTAVMALVKGYPKSLEGAAKAVGLDAKKDNRGKLLIRKFSVPRKPTKTKPWVYNNQDSDPQDWADFCDYCRQDVVVERELFYRLGATWIG